MTPRAKTAFIAYRDLGPTRTLEQAAKVLDRPWPNSTLRNWCAAYKWTSLCRDHDIKVLQAGFAGRDIAREHAAQRIYETMDQAVSVVYEIMTDRSKLPVLDRHGEHTADADGKPMYRYLVKASTRLDAAKYIMGIGGLIVVRKAEFVDRSEEALDKAAETLKTLTPEQLAKMVEILDD